MIYLPLHFPVKSSLPIRLLMSACHFPVKVVWGAVLLAPRPHSVLLSLAASPSPSPSHRPPCSIALQCLPSPLRCRVPGHDQRGGRIQPSEPDGGLPRRALLLDLAGRAQIPQELGAPGRAPAIYVLPRLWSLRLLLQRSFMPVKRVKLPLSACRICFPLPHLRVLSIRSYREVVVCSAVAFAWAGGHGGRRCSYSGLALVVSYNGVLISAVLLHNCLIAFGACECESKGTFQKRGLGTGGCGDWFRVFLRKVSATVKAHIFSVSMDEFSGDPTDDGDPFCFLLLLFLIPRRLRPPLLLLHQDPLERQALLQQGVVVRRPHRPLPQDRAEAYYNPRRLRHRQQDPHPPQVPQIAKTFREKGIPCDVIWMDIDYMDGFRCFTFDKRFPDPKSLFRDLHAIGFNVVWMLDLGIKHEPGYFVYDSGSKNDVWILKEDGKPFIDFVFNGVDGIWNDMNEPAIFKVVTKTMPESNIHRGDTELGGHQNHSHYHNVYGMLMARSTYEGMKMASGERRPFVLTRAGFIGSQRCKTRCPDFRPVSWDDWPLTRPGWVMRWCRVGGA
ncbi:hypothetical protein Taro_029251 [Colocasia esculenta]|uniref:Glycoside hydrolase family 31 TIM barrel domain-containing protein n=1 Tax=Colocasia esculenta TaxID=4460 RepID=A0A843VNJ0_COLES|nr:hypothetical protein [Colocasia esculenta]